MLGLGLVLSLGKKLYSDLIGRLLQKLATRGTYSENLASSRSLVTEIDNAGVLDDATILLTPTAYSNTRVHSVKTYTGDELVTNGTFDTDSDWTIPIGWSIANGVATVTNTINQQLRQPLTFANGKTYKISFEITEITQGSLRVYLRDGGNQGFVGGTYNTVGVKEFVVKATTTSDTLAIYPTSTTTASIDNISVLDVSSDFAFDRASSATRINSDGLVQDMQSITDVELVQNGDFEELGSELVTNGTFDTDSDWTLGTGTTIESGFLNFTSASSNTDQSLTTTNGKTYKVVYTVSNYSSGSVRFRFTGVANVNGTNRSANGTYTEYITATSNNSIFRFAASSFTGSIDNVSVQQVDPNDEWTLGTGWSIEDGKLVGDGTMTASNVVTQSYDFIDGNTYKFTFEITERTQGSVFIREPFNGAAYATGEVGTHTVYGVAGAANEFRLRSSDNFIGKIDNISIKDVTFSEDVDLARINYDSNGENGHWLLEPTSTNLITYSEDFSEWTSAGVTVEGGYLAPDGNNSAYKVSGTVGSSSIYLAGLAGVNETNTRTIWAKTVSGTGTVNLCSYGQNTNNNFTITENWQRFEVNGTTTSTGAANFYAVDFRFEEPNALSELIIWGAQAEALSYATSYIPTYGSTVTRATETLNGSGNSTLINSTEGVLYAEIAALVDDSSAREITLSDGTANNRVELRYGAASDRIQLVVRSGGVVQSSLTNSTNNILNFNKVAVKWKANDFAIWINGVEQGSDTSGSTPIGLNELQFNEGDGSGGEFYGKFKALAVFDRALTDQELTDLTS